MKILKIEFTNFKPYYGEDLPLPLYDEKRPNKKLTLNIGPTGHGKTSISEAIMWCLFGEQYKQDWRDWVNTLAIAVAPEKKTKEVPIRVKLHLEISGKNFQIVRSGIYLLDEQAQQETKTRILYNGQPYSMQPVKFINENFTTVDLMKYFIFDADEMLQLFEINQEQTIRDHISKIVGVGDLNSLIDTLKETKELFCQERSELGKFGTAEISEGMTEHIAQKSKKETAIEELNRDIRGWEKEKGELFGGKQPDEKVKRYSELVDSIKESELELEKINTKFFEADEYRDTVKMFSLLFLEDVINTAVKELDSRPTTKSDFDSSAAIIKSALGDNYSGLLFDKENGNKCDLIDKALQIPKDKLHEINQLQLVSADQKVLDSRRGLHRYQESIPDIKDKFSQIKTQFNKIRGELIMSRQNLKQLGESETNHTLKEKYEKYCNLGKKIASNRSSITGLEEEISKIEEKIRELEEKKRLDEEESTRRDIISKNIEETEKLCTIVEEGKETFLGDLLKYVNDKASQFLCGSIRDTDRFNSIEIDTNYRLHVKDSLGNILKEDQINKGTMQISLMAFLFGLSSYLGEHIPYVIDNPMIRLDPGHDKRLITQLKNSKEQIIMHLIPGKEYTTDSFGWLEPNLNTQNWIKRRQSSSKFKREISSIENRSSNKIIAYNIDNL